MKYLYLLLISSLMLSACSASKEVEFTSLDQAECRNEMQITDQNQFAGETAENLMVYQQSNLVFASMDVRTYCNARITFDFERDGERVKLKLKNASSINDDCVCITNITTSFKNLEPGTYTVMVTNSAGSQLLAQESVTIE